MKTVLCFGDSNTYGTCPMRERSDTRRHALDERWPGVLQAALGGDWRVIEEGLPGRTIARDDPVEGADRNALRYLPACLQSHRPLDAVVFMLGTNDAKARFGLDGAAIAQSAHALLDCVLQHSPAPFKAPRVLLVCPPAIREVGCLAEFFQGAELRSAQMRPALQQLARDRGVAFLDAGAHATMCATEGIHMESGAHARLGAAVAAMLGTLFA